MKRLVVNHIDKYFPRQRGNRSALAATINLFGSRKRERVRALNDISLQLGEHEVLGLIGRNGAGKTTLLKTIAGIYQPNAGSIQVTGKSLYISGLGGGLKPRLTVSDNINLICRLLGIGGAATKQIFDPIVEFAEVQQDISTKVFSLSQGMVTRLLIAIMLHSVENIDAEILLLDEVLSHTTDSLFTQKSYDKMKALIKTGRSVIITTHSLNYLLDLSTRAIMLDHGCLVREGATKDVVNYYISSNAATETCAL